MLGFRRKEPEIHEYVHVYVTLEQDEDGFPPYKAEEVDACLVRPGVYRIESIPVWVYGLSKADLVSVVRAEPSGQLWLERVVEAGPNWTSRVVPVGANTLEDIAMEFQQLGCEAYPTIFGMVAVSVHNSRPSEPILRRLRNGEDTSRWHFDLGVSPPDESPEFLS